MPKDEKARLGVLYPAVAEAARRARAVTIGLVALGGGFTEEVPVAGARGRPLPTRALPEVVFRETVEPASLESLPEVIARVPAAALPVVTTAWALSGLVPGRRLRFLQLLDEAAAHRTLAWVSAEGVGVAPGVPTLGDRRASGHSIVGVAVLEHHALHVEAVGRCWSRGRHLAWFAD